MNYSLSADNQGAKQDEATPETGLYFYRDVLAELVEAMAVYKWRVLPDPKGRWCGWEVYGQASSLIEGLTPPKDFYRWAKLSSKEDIEAFNDDLKQWVSDKMAIAENRSLKLILKRIADSFLDIPNDTRSPVAQISRQLLGTNEPPQVTLTGRKGAYKVVPALDWFPSNLKAYDVSQELILFPEAERKMLMLHWGRVLVGASGEFPLEATNAPLVHGYRNYCIIVGQGTHGAGTGKSTLQNWFIECLEQLGYQIGILNTDVGGRFGWASLYQADYLYCDDLARNTQKKIITSDRIKSLVSNGRLFAEEKGEPGTEIRSRTAFTANSNSHDYRDLFEADPGILARLCQLDTYTKREMGVDLRTHWENLAESLGVSVHLLMARLMKQCVDYFLETTGHSIVNQQLVRDPARDTLNPTIEALRAEFRIDTDVTHVSELVRACFIAKCLSVILLRQAKIAVPESLYRLGFGVILLHAVISVNVACPHEVPLFPELKLTELNEECRGYLKPKLAKLSSNQDRESFASALDSLTEEMRSSKGFKYPKGLSTYQAEWELWEKQWDHLLPEYKTVYDSCSTFPEELACIQQIILEGCRRLENKA